MDNPNEIEMFSPEEMLSPFEAIKETDAEGREWWNSRKLAQIDAMMDINNIGNSYESVQFRIWARNILKEYIIKGYVMDDERLKGNIPFGTDYFNNCHSPLTFECSGFIYLSFFRSSIAL